MNPRLVTRLHDQLLDAQFELERSGNAAVLLIVTGVSGAGRTETVHQLIDWLDPKHVTVRAFEHADRDQRRYPAALRYWQALPSRGRIAIHFNGWYDEPLAELLAPRAQRGVWNAASICELERMLYRDRIVIAKVHLHIDAQLQRERLQMLRADPLTRWRVTARDVQQMRQHRQCHRGMTALLRATDHRASSWKIIDSSDPERRAYEVGSILLRALRRAQRLPTTQPSSGAVARAQALSSTPPASWSDDTYERELKILQGRFALLARSAAFKRRGLVVAFEGMDAAGKGGAIRRVIEALDVRQYEVVPVSAPTVEELSYPYLWRFWRRIPERGAVRLFDRSWYGRVLVERVRGLTPRADWRRAYDEIVGFETQLGRHGLIVVKFWLSVSKAEQLKRFRKRDRNPLKRFKVDPEDWRNRRFYDEYQCAAREMIARTSTPTAPWIVVEADEKKFARLKVLRTLCEALERELHADTPRS